MAAPESDNVETFAIGDLSATALRDGTLVIPNDNEVFGVGRSPEEVATLLAAAGLPADELHLSVQPLLVKTATRVLLFDTGAGSNMGPSAGRLPASLAAAGIDPDDITDVFISHAHGDHVGGLLNAQGALAFPNARIHISSPEWAFLKGMDAGTAAGPHAALVSAMAPKVIEFTPGANIIPGVVEAVEIRGHTSGHSGYLITSGGESLLYIGDAMHHFVVSVQKPAWANSFDTDVRTAEASRAELLARSAASGQRIYAVHFPFPGLGEIERRADGFIWVPE
ncbi:MAG TPA: MBL fold metallo-hydrolase [Longimicrobiales bacterium]